MHRLYFLCLCSVVWRWYEEVWVERGQKKGTRHSATISGQGKKQPTLRYMATSMQHNPFLSKLAHPNSQNSGPRVLLQVNLGFPRSLFCIHQSGKACPLTTLGLLDRCYDLDRPHWCKQKQPHMIVSSYLIFMARGFCSNVSPNTTVHFLSVFSDSFGFQKAGTFFLASS